MTTGANKYIGSPLLKVTAVIPYSAHTSYYLPMIVIRSHADYPALKLPRLYRRRETSKWEKVKRKFVKTIEN